MKDNKLLDHLKTPAVAPLGSFFCPEPRLENGSFHKYCEWSGVTPWNSSSTETKLSAMILFHGVTPWNSPDTESDVIGP